MTSQSTFSPTDFIFLPLGGSGEIGMNLNLYGYDGSWIIVDIGLTFADQYFPGIDIMVPDPWFIEERRQDLKGIVLTHGHEDHLGALPWLWERLRCPVYATPFTAELARGKLAEAGLLDQVPLHVVPLGGEIDLEPFHIRFISMTHSMPEANALVIETAAGRVLHSGDWKLDPAPQVGKSFDREALEELGKLDIAALVCDSTNVLSPGTSGSELSLLASLTRLIKAEKGRVAVTSFASNIARIRTISQAAAAADRRVVLVGRSLHRMVSAARATGYLTDIPNFIAEKKAGYFAAEHLVYLCTGSQGEVRGAMMRIATGSNANITLGEGDCVIFSSKIIPGNETQLARLFNLFAEKGVKVITEKDAAVHVSGHPCRDELAELYAWVKPKASIPVHGEARHLYEHARLARELGVSQAIPARNGQAIRLEPNGLEIIGEWKVGRLAVDGHHLVRLDDPNLRQRRQLALDGYVIVTLVFDTAGKLCQQPAVKLKGLPVGGDEAEIVAGIQEAVGKKFLELSVRDHGDDGKMREEIRIHVRRLCRKSFGKRPMVEIQFLRPE